MAYVKVRRWKSLVPVLSPKNGLTTREMVSKSDTLFGGGGTQEGSGADTRRPPSAASMHMVSQWA
jgi:hypothetical protein